MQASKFLFLFLFSTVAIGQKPASPSPSDLPDAPSQVLLSEAAALPPQLPAASDSQPFGSSERFAAYFPQQDSGAEKAKQSDRPAGAQVPEHDINGNPIPLERQQPKRILGFMPNFRSVSGGATPHPPGFRYNFTVATHQALDYSSFIFLGLTSLTAEATNSHPALGKGVDGLWAYTWRGFLDKSDNTYLSAWLLPSILHEDTRYYSLGHGSILHRALYVISRQAIARTYGGHDTPNLAGLGGKALTQYISRTYYPPSATNFSVLATKFGYSVMRDVGFTAIREFYPSIAAHYIRKHREEQLKLQQGTHGAPPAP